MDQHARSLRLYMDAATIQQPMLQHDARAIAEHLAAAHKHTKLSCSLAPGS